MYGSEGEDELYGSKDNDHISAAEYDTPEPDFVDCGPVKGE